MIKRYVLIFFSGIILGVLSTLYFSYAYYARMEQGKSVSVKQLSGEKIAHSRWKFEGTKLSFKTSAEGKGEIMTEVPKTLIPEANAWLTRNNSIQINMGLNYSEKTYPLYGISYWRRFDSISIGGGILLSRESFGFIGGAQYWF